MAKVGWAVAVGVLLLAPWATTAAGPEQDPSAGPADDSAAQGTFSRTLTGVRWHAIRISMNTASCPTGFQGTLSYTASYGGTEAPQQAFVAFRTSTPTSPLPDVTFGLHHHVVDGRTYTAAVVDGSKTIQSAAGLNKFAPSTPMTIFAAGGCASTQYFVYWSSGSTNVQVSFSWTTGVTVTDSWGTADTFAYTKADMGGVQARHGTQCNPTCRFVGAGAAMSKPVPITKRMVGAFLPDPGAPTDNCTPTVNGEYSCNNWNGDIVVAQQSLWRSPTGRTRLLAPVVDERIFVIGTAAETGTWTFSTTVDVDLNPLAAALSGVDVQLP